LKGIRPTGYPRTDGYTSPEDMAVEMVEEALEPFTILGTGFCIHPRGIIVSCQHVFSAFMSKSVQEQIADIPKELEKKKFIPTDSGISIPHAVFFDTQYSKHKMQAIPAPMDIATIKTDYDIGMMRIQSSKAFPKGLS
jgi:hypothetical protein